MKEAPVLAAESDLLKRFQQDVEQAGLVGEERNAKTVFLAAVSAKLDSPLHVTAQGSSAAGKNWLTGRVAEFLPPESRKFISGMTPKTLMHAGEHEFEHMAVFVAEQEGVNGADYAIRTFQSEKIIQWEFVEKGNDGIKKKTTRVKGPAAFITCTTRNMLHPENETRLLFVHMDESAEQTRRINKRQAVEAAQGTAAVPPELFEKWHEHLRSLKETSVRILFAPQLAECFPAESVRSRRDFPKVVALIEVSAYLHQHQRHRDSEGNIVAVPQDYFIAKDVFEHCYRTGPDAAIADLIGAVEQLPPRKEEFTVADLMEKLGWRKSKTYSVLSRTEELGYIAKAEAHGCYRLVKSQAEPSLCLPAKIRLSARDFRVSTQAGYQLAGAAVSTTAIRCK